MSRAFVKDADETFDELPDRPISPHPNIVTPEGLAAIEAALTRLQQERAHAQASNDRAALATLSREVRYWTSRRASAQVVGRPINPTRVEFGCSVTICGLMDASKPTGSLARTKRIPRVVQSHTSHRSHKPCSANRLVKRCGSVNPTLNSLQSLDQSFTRLLDLFSTCIGSRAPCAIPGSCELKPNIS